MVCPFNGMEFVDALEAHAVHDWSGARAARQVSKSVQLLEGDDVWAAGESGPLVQGSAGARRYPRSDAAAGGLTVMDGRMQRYGHLRPCLPQLVKDPAPLILYRVQRREPPRPRSSCSTAPIGTSRSRRARGRSRIDRDAILPCARSIRETTRGGLTAKIEQMFCDRNRAPIRCAALLLTTGILEAAMTSQETA